MAWLALAGSGCVREHTLFEDDSSAGEGGTNSAGTGTAGTSGAGAGSAGAAGTGGAGTSAAGGSGEGGSAPSAGGSAGTATSGPPWQKSSCVAALSGGKTGDPCVAAFECSATADCCQIIAACKTGTLVIQSTCGLCSTSCSADSDCAFGELCENYQCTPCPKDPCPSSWMSVTRNACSVCVPLNACKSNNDCAAGMTCSAGLSCLPGCKADPSCCFGNQCASAACGATTELDCLLVGCPAGSFCKAGGDPPQCKCDDQSGQWLCSAPSNDVCVAR